MFALIKASALNKAGLQPDKSCVIDEDGKGFTVVLDTPDFKSQPDWVDLEGKGHKSSALLHCEDVGGLLWSPLSPSMKSSPS